MAEAPASDSSSAPKKVGASEDKSSPAPNGGAPLSAPASAAGGKPEDKPAPKKEVKPLDSSPSQSKVKAPGSPPSPGSTAKLKAGPSSTPKMAGAAEGKPSPAPVSQPKLKVPAPKAPEIPVGQMVEPARPRAPERSKAPLREDASEIRARRRPDAVQPRKGAGLQLKIMLAMGLTSLLGAAGIAVAVYSRATTAFEEQVNERGERLVEILAAVPADYWVFAIHGQNRPSDFIDLMKAIEPVDDVVQKPEFARLQNILANPFSKEWQEEIDRFFTAVSKNAEWKAKIEANPELKLRYERLVRPMAPLSQLAPFKDLAKSGDLVEVGVVDPAKGVGIMPKGRVTVSPPPARSGERITKVDVPVDGIPSRMFILNPDPENPVPLRYFVTLSLLKIGAAKKSILQMVFIPALVAMGASLAIAAVLSHQITKPVRLLMEDINQVSSGDFEHQTSARSSDEIGQLAASFNRMTTALRAAQQQELAARAMEHELGIASEIQTNLVPKSILKVPGYDIGAYYRPSKEVGGDYYDFIEIDENRSGLIVADVSGKGVPGSLVMAMARAFIRMEAERSRNPSTADTLARANKMLARDMRKGMFVTAIYGILDRTNHQIRVSSAGHNPMILWRSRSEEIVLINPKGIALGLDKGPVFDRSISEEIIQLEPGDRVVIYTDGTVEAMNAKREEFGDRPFQDLVRKLAKTESNQFLNLIVKALDEHQGNAPQHDDMTIVTFRRV